MRYQFVETHLSNVYWETTFNSRLHDRTGDKKFCNLQIYNAFN